MRWTCKDGRVLEVKDMTTAHLRNALAMLRRNGYVTWDEYEGCARYAFSPMSGDMAAMCAEQSLYSMRPRKIVSVMEEELCLRTRTSPK